MGINIIHRLLSVNSKKSFSRRKKTKKFPEKDYYKVFQSFRIIPIEKKGK